MSQQNRNKNNIANADKIYYDINIANTISSTQSLPFIYFNETRSIPYLNKPEDYYMSIVRFSIDSPVSIVPAFVPLLDTNALSPNVTAYQYQFYTIDMSGNTFVSDPYNVVWQPQDISLPAPTTPPNNETRYSDPYYYCYTYNYFLSLINSQIATNFLDFINYNRRDNDAVYGEEGIVPPLFEYSNVDNLFTITFGSYWNLGSLYRLPVNVVTPQFGLAMNPAMIQLFSGLNFSLNGLGPLQLPYIAPNFYIIQVDYFSKNAVTYNYITATNTTDDYSYSISSIDGYFVTQELTSTALWTPISSLCFISNTLPIEPNQTSKPLIYEYGLELNNQSNNAVSANIITDIIADSGLYSNSLIYEPTAQYRLISLSGNSPLNNIDVSVYWRDRIGVLHPFLLGSGCNATLKILFTKKETEQYK